MGPNKPPRILSPCNTSSEFPSASTSRRPSYQMKRNSASRSSFSVIAPRYPQPPPPKDIDAFTFSAQFLQDWHISESIWAALPDYMRRHLAALQHAGAATMTSFHRLDEMRTLLNGKVEDESDLERIVPTRTPSMSSLPSLQSGSQSPTFSSTATPATPALAEFPFVIGSTKMLDAPFPQLQAARSRSMSHYTPPSSDPRIGQWRAEVHTLQTESIVRLRHAMQRVSMEWRSLLMQLGRLDCVDKEAWEVLTYLLEAWLDDKREKVVKLELKTKELGLPVCLGWGEL